MMLHVPWFNDTYFLDSSTPEHGQSISAAFTDKQKLLTAACSADTDIRESQNCFGLGGTCKTILFQTRHKQDHLPLYQVASNPIKPGLEHTLEWSMHNQEPLSWGSITILPLPGNKADHVFCKLGSILSQ